MKNINAGKDSNVRKYFIWLAIPTIAAIAGVLLSGRISVMPEKSVSLSQDYKSLKDPKLKRTVKSFLKKEGLSGNGEYIDAAIVPGLPIHIQMSAEHFNLIKRMTKGSSHIDDVFDVEIAFGEMLPQRASLRIRGGSTLNLPRKNFRINLFRAHKTGKDITFKKFYLISMAQDKGEFRMRFSYLLLKELGLFPGYNEYVAVYVNGAPQGLYLFVERPVDAIRRTAPDTVFVARGGRLKDVKYRGREPEALALLKRFVSAQTIRDPEQRFHEYKTILDMDSYLKWIAFNSLVKNGDSRGEYFCYEARPEKKRFGIIGLMAWDYDGIMSPVAHPERSFEDPLMYACEEPIDFFIKQNPELYSRYKQILRAMLTDTMTTIHLIETLDMVSNTLNGLDTGRSKEQQVEERNYRQKRIASFSEKLIERHGVLAEILGI